MTIETNVLKPQGYRVILAERRGTLSGQRDKLRNGLTKLEEAKEQVCGCLFLSLVFFLYHHREFTLIGISTVTLGRLSGGDHVRRA